MISILPLLGLGFVLLLVVIAYGVLKILNSSSKEEEDYRFRWSPAWDETRMFGDLHYAQIGEE